MKRNGFRSPPTYPSGGKNAMQTAREARGLMGRAVAHRSRAGIRFSVRLGTQAIRPSWDPGMFQTNRKIRVALR